MKYSDVLEELKEKGSNRDEPALNSTRRALDKLECPEDEYKTILVGGTNGKGSTVEMISEILQSLGKDVGVYKSPHLVEVTERIKVNSEQISKQSFGEIYGKIENIDEELSFFEFLTTMAFLYFNEQNVDYAVMEVGMGGRLDATNAVENDNAVITNIDLDHTKYLGDSIQEIAREKAGIIPENGVLITPSEINNITQIANKRNADKIKPEKVQRSERGYIFKEEVFSLPVKGGFQKFNLETALATVKAVEKLPENLETSLSNLECPGRMEIIVEEPLYIQDGAHNPAAIEKIIEDLPEQFGCVFSAVEGKDFESMIKILERKASKFYFTKSNVDRSLKPSELAEKASIDYKCFEKPSEAERKALEEQESMVATGSLYLIGDLKKDGKQKSISEN